MRRFEGRITPKGDPSLKQQRTLILNYAIRSSNIGARIHFIAILFELDNQIAQQEAQSSEGADLVSSANLQT